MQTTNRSAEEHKIRTLVEEWAAAVRREDINAILANHSPDLVMFDVPPPFESVGLEAYRKTWDKFFACNSGLGVFDVDDMTIIAGEDVAFVVARMRCAGLEKDGSRSTTDLRFRLTVGLKKIDGNWTIVHEHHSVPADE
jgi:uncharacterized protein (TIGR02246 family)